MSESLGERVTPEEDLRVRNSRVIQRICLLFTIELMRKGFEGFLELDVFPSG